MMLLSFLKNTFGARRAKYFSIFLSLISVFTVTTLYYNQNQFLEAFESRSYDLRFKSLRGAIPINPEIGIVKIDDKSIAELGRFPWSRVQYVRLLQRLSAAGAKAVLFDVFFPEAESQAVDQSLAAAIKKAGNVGLAVAYEIGQDAQISNSTHTLAHIEANAAGIGHINFSPDEDGVNRRNQLLIAAEGKQVASLGLLGAMMALGEKKFDARPFNIKLGNISIPVDGDYRMWVNYTGPPGRYPSFSFADIVQGRVSPEKLKGKILFVGSTALGIYDMRVTPYDGNTPGVETHAVVADNILTGRFIQRTGIEAMYDLVLIISLSLFTFYFTKRTGFHIALLGAILLTTSYVWFAFWMFKQGSWLSMIYPPLAVVVSLLLAGSFRYLVLERSARELRSIFSSYHSDKLVARLEKNPEAAQIGGDSKDITIIFTDIKGFTSFSEQHTPQEVVKRLNEYLSVMVTAIEEYDGYVDKFIGDGIMAFWGAPFAQAHHAKLALACVLSMQESMKKMRVKWQADGVESFTMRAGIQSGEVVAGNVGLRGKKMEYTVIGDTVNQAARLEGSAKYYGVDTLVGENTYHRTCGEYGYRELDKIRMVGKQIPVTVYELTGRKDSEENQLNKDFSVALAKYRERKWEEAEKLFSALVAAFPEDRPSKIYLERCQFFEVAPALDDWDGVFNRRGK